MSKSKEQKERRVINIPKKEFDNLKKYCDENSLDMPKWIVNQLNEFIKYSERSGFRIIRVIDILDKYEELLLTKSLNEENLLIEKWKSCKNIIDTFTKNDSISNEYMEEIVGEMVRILNEKNAISKQK